MNDQNIIMVMYGSVYYIHQMATLYMPGLSLKKS